MINQNHKDGELTTSWSFSSWSVCSDCQRELYGQFAADDHPVTWLRIRLLASRARQLGWSEAADEIEADWSNIAVLLGLQEDYFGCFDEEFLAPLNQTIEDMLTETNPRLATPDEVKFCGDIDNSTSPPAVLNAAWQSLHQKSADYSSWETATISRWLAD
jgi:hypothetical protein